jgi:hypothetical protein
MGRARIAGSLADDERNEGPLAAPMPAGDVRSIGCDTMVALGPAASTEGARVTLIAGGVCVASAP